MGAGGSEGLVQWVHAVRDFLFLNRMTNLPQFFATVIGGAACGLLSGGLVALVILTLLPGDNPIGIHNLSKGVGWALFFGSPGALIGAGVGVLLYSRARKVRTLRRLLVESVCVCATTFIVAVQVFLPIAAQLPRIRIAVLTGRIASGVGALRTSALWPLCRQNPQNPQNETY